MVAGGMCGCGGACIGYDEIWSMSGRYASYWNAFLFKMKSTLKFLRKVRVSLLVFQDADSVLISPFFWLCTSLYQTSRDGWSNSIGLSPVCFKFVVKLSPHSYHPQRSCGNVMFIRLSVILFTGQGLCPGGLCPGSLCPEGSLSRGSLCPGGALYPGGLWGGSLSGRPPYGYVWAVRILLECILVSSSMFCTILLMTLLCQFPFIPKHYII